MFPIKKLAIASLLVVLVSPNAFAAKASDRDVQQVIVSNNGKVTVRISGADVNPAGCSNTAYVIDADEQSKKEWIAQLLTAKAAGFQVTLSINDNVCANGGNNPKISNIIVE